VFPLPRRRQGCPALIRATAPFSSGPQKRANVLPQAAACHHPHGHRQDHPVREVPPRVPRPHHPAALCPTPPSGVGRRRGRRDHRQPGLQRRDPGHRGVPPADGVPLGPRDAQGAELPGAAQTQCQRNLLPPVPLQDGRRHRQPVRAALLLHLLLLRLLLLLIGSRDALRAPGLPHLRSHLQLHGQASAHPLLPALGV